MGNLHCCYAEGRQFDCLFVWLRAMHNCGCNAQCHISYEAREARASIYRLDVQQEKHISGACDTVE